MTFDATSSITTDGNLTSLGVTVGSDSTLASAAGATISSAATIASATVTVAADATTSGDLTLGESTTTHTATSVTLAEAAANGMDLNLLGATFTKVTVTLDGSTAITAGTVDLDATAAVANGLQFNFDGNAGAINIAKGLLNTTVATVTELVLNVGSSTGGNTLDVSYASKANVTGGTGADAITGTAGADTISGGSGADTIIVSGGADSVDGGTGNDTITGGTGADTLTGGSGADTFIFAAGDSGTVSGTVFDTVTDFAVGTGGDLFDLAGAAVIRANTSSGVDVKTAITSGTGTEVVTASVTSGIITLAGANASAIDTLTEWLAVARLVNTTTLNVAGFEFGGNTYLYQECNTATTTDDILIQLTGITGITALGASAAAATVPIVG